MNRLHKVGHLGDLLILVRRIKLLMWFVRHKVRPGHVVLSVVASIALSAPHLTFLFYSSLPLSSTPTPPSPYFSVCLSAPPPPLSLSGTASDRPLLWQPKATH